MLCGDYDDIQPRNVYHNKVEALDEWSEIHIPNKVSSVSNMPLQCVLDIYSTTGAVKINIKRPVEQDFLQAFGAPSSPMNNTRFSSPIASVTGSDILGYLTAGSAVPGLSITLNYIRTPNKGYHVRNYYPLGWFSRIKEPGREIINFILYSHIYLSLYPPLFFIYSQLKY